MLVPCSLCRPSNLLHATSAIATNQRVAAEQHRMPSRAEQTKSSCGTTLTDEPLGDGECILAQMDRGWAGMTEWRDSACPMHSDC